MTCKRHVVMFTMGFCAGNFIWQALTGHHWGIAIERSFFQAVLGLMIAWRVKL